MPYGSTYRRGYRRKYTAPVRKYRRSSTIPPKKKTTRAYVRTNALINRRQSGQIRRLFNMRYGPVQRNLHLSNTPMFVNATQPIAFDASDFTCQRTPATGGTSPGCQFWQVNNLLLQITQAGGFAPVGANNALWAPSNIDIPDGGRYKPLYAEYQIEVKGRRNIDDCWVQVDLFTQHHVFQSWQLAGAGQSVNQRIMPYALTNMGNMVDVNELNPSLFKRYKRMRKLINSQTLTNEVGGEVTGFTSTTTNTKYFKFRVAPKRPRNQVFTAPDTPGIDENGADQTVYGDYGLYQVDPRTPFWCMISATDRTSLDGDSLEVSVRRHVVWRDINGGTYL